VEDFVRLAPEGCTVEHSSLGLGDYVDTKPRKLFVRATLSLTPGRVRQGTRDEPGVAALLQESLAGTWTSDPFELVLPAR
jgi:hypothetical protein